MFKITQIDFPVTNITFSSIGMQGPSGSGGGGGGSGDLLSTNNLSDVANTTTSRNNLGAISAEESIINALIFG